MTLHTKTIVERNTPYPVDTADNPVNHVLQDVLGCFVAWLEHNPSDQKNYLILLALAKESLKRAKITGQPARFDKKEIAAAANVVPDEVDLQSWFRWPDIEKYWNARRDNYIVFASMRGIDAYPTLHRTPTAGRNMAEHWMECERLPTADSDECQTVALDAVNVPSEPTDTNHKHIRYDVTQPGGISCAFWLKPWLATGSFKIDGWRRWSVIGTLLLLGSVVLLSVVYGYVLVVKPDLLSKYTFATFLLLALLAYIVWVCFMRPLVHLLNDRIVYTNMAVSISEEPAQLEVMKIENGRIIRLVRYTAACPICGATVSLENGEPDFRRRLVGLCAESPREHLFSFDRITRKGILLR